jgi:hypothetical protein
MTEVKALVGEERGNLMILRWLKMTGDSRGIVGSWEVVFPEARTS